MRPLRKTLGPDNINTKFYLTFHNRVIPLLEDIYNHAIAFGELPMDLLNRDIIIIPKAGDPTYVIIKGPLCYSTWHIKY